MIKTLLTISYGCALILLTSFQINAQVEGNPRLNALPVPQGPMNKSSSKLSEPLTKLYESYAPASSLRADAKSKPSLEDIPMMKYMQIKGDRVLVDITVKEFNNKTRVQLENMGLQINAVYGRVVSGTVPIASLPLFESAGIIKFIKASYKFKHQPKSLNAFGSNGLQISTPSPVISQGDTALRSYLARKNYGVTGKGVKVGILSDSYNNLGTAETGVKNGELPGPGNPFGYIKPVQVLVDLGDTSGIDEGRGMAEIVHDVAPGAEIAFHSAYLGEASFADGIIKLAEAGCKVIVDDVIYLNEPFFQDGIIAQAVDKVKKAGVSYFTSAGNLGDNSYGSEYRPTKATPLGAANGTAHNFNGPGIAPTYYQPIYIPIKGVFVTSFQWDQPSFSAGGVGTASDLDIYLLDVNGRVVAGSAESNIVTGDPAEVFGYYNNTKSDTFFVVILKYEGPDPTYLKCINFGDQLYYRTIPAIPGSSGSTIFGHANAEGAITTGAANYIQTPAYGSDTPRVEDFSSVGGTGILFDDNGKRINTVLRKKPEFTSVDGGNTSFFYSDSRQDTDTFPNFFGTSAAAPHAAAVAALMIEAQKINNITPSQIKGIMSTNTIDMDNPYFTGFQTGFDWATGTGFLKADASVGVVKFPNIYVKNVLLKAVCSDEPDYTRKWVISNPNPFEVEVHWLINGFSQQGTVIAGPGETTFTTQTVYFFNRPVSNIAIINWNDNLGIPHFDYAGSTTAKCGQDAVTAANSDKLSDMVANAESIDKSNAVTVYPNPASKYFRVYLSLSSQQNTDMSLYTLDGKLLLKRVVSSSGVVDIDASTYAPGMYILKINQKNFSKTLKLVKK
jgi:hypothetical protein